MITLTTLAASAALALQPAASSAEMLEPPVAAPTQTTAPAANTDAPPADLVEGQADYHKRMTVPVTIEGEGPFNFMIDTGAQATVVTRGLAEKLALPAAGQATVVGMAGTKSVDLFALNGLEFAARVFDNIEAPMLEARNIGADGILGLDSLQDLRVMIDFRENTIAVNDARELGGNKGYEIIVRARHRLGRLIITDAKIDGVKTAVVIDTGAQGSFGNPALKRKMRARNDDVVTSTDVLGIELTGNRSLAKTVRIQSMQLENMPITFADSPAFKALGLNERPALILGMRDLRLLNRIAIDFEKRQVLFDIPKNGSRRPVMSTGFGASRL